MSDRKAWTREELDAKEAEMRQEVARYRAGPGIGTEAHNEANARRYERRAELYQLAQVGWIWCYAGRATPQGGTDEA